MSSSAETGDRDNRPPTKYDACEAPQRKPRGFFFLKALSAGCEKRLATALLTNQHFGFSPSA